MHDYLGGRPLLAESGRSAPDNTIKSAIARSRPKAEQHCVEKSGRVKRLRP